MRIPFVPIFAFVALLFPLVQLTAQEPLTPEADLETSQPARIAIIIDDIGYSLRNGLRAARLPANVTLSVLPHTPNGAALAKVGFESGKDIMLHTPMANTRGVPLDKGALTEEMDQETFLATLRDNLQAVPHVIGVNNHMGSQLTQNPEAMDWLMTELKQQGLFFIDSRTSADSLAMATAISQQLPTDERDVFLDHERTQAFISKQFDYLLKLAKRDGHALAIGHPYPETLDLLEQRLPLLQAQGIELVSISELLQPAIKAQAHLDKQDNNTL